MLPDGTAIKVAGGSDRCDDGAVANMCNVTGSARQPIALAPDGSLYVVAQEGQLARITPAGRYEIVAGTLTLGHSPDGTLAKGADIAISNGLAIGPDGTI